MAMGNLMTRGLVLFINYYHNQIGQRAQVPGHNCRDPKVQELQQGLKTALPG